MCVIVVLLELKLGMDQEVLALALNLGNLKLPFASLVVPDTNKAIVSPCTGAVFFNQPVVSKVGITKSVMCSSDRCDYIIASYVSTFEVVGKQCVDSYKALFEVNDNDSEPRSELRRILLGK